MEPIVILGILWLLGRKSTPAPTPPSTGGSLAFLGETAATQNPSSEFGKVFTGIGYVGRSGGSGTVLEKPSRPVAPPTPVLPSVSVPTPAGPVLQPIIRPPVSTVIAPAPVTSPVYPITLEQPSQALTGTATGTPDFCFKEYTPLLFQQCPNGATEPSKRPGPPPDGAMVVTGPVPGAQRTNAWPSCPDTRGQGGVWYLTAGSPEWKTLCGTRQTELL